MTREENLKIIIEETELMSDDELDTVSGGFIFRKRKPDPNLGHPILDPCSYTSNDKVSIK